MDLTQGKILGCSEVRAAREAECHGDRQPFFCRRLQTDLPRENEGEKVQQDWLGRFCEWNSRRCARQTAIGATESIFPPAAAKKFVDQTFEDCYADCSPFKPTEHIALDNTRALDDDPPGGNVPMSAEESGDAEGGSLVDKHVANGKGGPLRVREVDAVDSAPTAFSQRSQRVYFTKAAALRACIDALPGGVLHPLLHGGRNNGAHMQQQRHTGAME
jgi:hypothetical protein